MLDIISKIAAVVVSITTAGITIYKTFFNGNKQRIKEYYDILLKPFISAYKVNQTINVIEFVKRKVKPDDDNIPKYVFALINESKTLQNNTNNEKEDTLNVTINDTNEKLKKVLIHDYLSLYPNETNNKCSILVAIRRLLSYTFLFLSLFCIILAILYVFMKGSSFVSSLFLDAGFVWKNFVDLIVALFKGIGVVLFCIIYILYLEMRSKDMYTTKKKKIYSIINKKISDYNKMLDDHIL